MSSESTTSWRYLARRQTDTTDRITSSFVGSHAEVLFFPLSMLSSTMEKDVFLLFSVCLCVRYRNSRSFGRIYVKISELRLCMGL